MVVEECEQIIKSLTIKTPYTVIILHGKTFGGYVYLIFERDCFGKDGAKFLKIGCTSTPKSAARRIEKEADRGSQNAAENYKGK